MAEQPEGTLETELLESASTLRESHALKRPLRLDRLPRTIELVRNEGRVPTAPDDSPVVILVDQTRLPYELTYLVTDNWRRVMHAIRDLQVRGAPALGVAGACAVCLRAEEFITASAADLSGHSDDLWHTFVLDDLAFDTELYWTALEFSATMVANTRPTAVNLAWGIKQALDVAKAALEAGASPQGVVDAVFNLVKRLEAEDEVANRAMGRFGAELVPSGARVLTHCNAGSLATVFFGTALGVIYEAARVGRVERVYADETRPVNQGARLTAWELSRAGVPVTLICDDMAASLMASGEIDLVITGADRIAANGDAANKIGTYGLAVLARYHGIPFYVVAPVSTIDLSTPTGAAIPIEERAATEVLDPPLEGVDVYNPAFDVTPAHLISAIITEKGVFYPDGIAKALESSPSDGEQRQFADGNDPESTVDEGRV